MTQQAIPADVRERVISAAADLYEQSGRERFPTVDAVRRLSRADMNAVSSVMKEWRQAQTTQVAPVAVAVPEAIQQANAAALAALWLNALDLGNQNLRNAQSGWEKERQELDDMRGELATSYEQQAAEFEAVKNQLAASEEKTAIQGLELAALRQDLNEAAAKEAALSATADQMQHQIESQRAELVRLHAEAEAVRNQHTVDIDRLTADFSRQLAEQLAALQAAKEEAERMRAQLVDSAARFDVVSTRERAKIEEAATAKAEAIRLAEQLATQKNQSTTEIEKLEAINQKLETHLTALQKETHGLGAELGKATGGIEALRAQVAEQNNVIKKFADQAVKKPK